MQAERVSKAVSYTHLDVYKRQEAASYLAAHYKKDYYDVVNKSCKAAKAEENSR